MTSALKTQAPAKRGMKDLYRSQDHGVTRLYEADVLQFVAPMGYGKTAVCMTAMNLLMQDRVIRRGLVIAPKRVAQLVWPREKDDWSHLEHLNIVLVTGTPEQRRQKLIGNDADIYVVGIDNVPWLCDVLETLPDHHPIFDLLVVDELSRLKSPRGVWSKALRKVAHRFRIRWGLTGTPRPNGLIDQFAPLSFLTDNQLWGRSFDMWRQRHFYPTDFQQRNWVPHPAQLTKLEDDIAGVTHVVDASDMLDLPELVVRDHWLDLDATARAVYRAMERDLVAEGIAAANTAVATSKLAQIVNGFLYEAGDVAFYSNDTKSNALTDLVEALDGQPVIVVYEFREDLARMQAEWPGLPYLGAGVGDREAMRHERDWNEGKLPILAIHPAAAGHGLNLQHGGNQMIFYGMPWSAELYDQTIKRIHRTGQKERTFIHRLLARDTLDVAKVRRVEGKISEAEAWRQYLLRKQEAEK